MTQLAKLRDGTQVCLTARHDHRPGSPSRHTSAERAHTALLSATIHPRTPEREPHSIRYQPGAGRPESQARGVGRPGQGFLQAAKASNQAVQAGQGEDMRNGAVSGGDQPQLAAG